MTPTDIDMIAQQIKSATGAAHIEIRITYHGSSMTHEAGHHPADDEDWDGIVDRIKAERARVVNRDSEQ